MVELARSHLNRRARSCKQ